MATIQGIYIALFGRPADPAGLAFFNEATNNGADLTAIGDLASTDEYQERFTGLTREEVVNSIYQSLFGREGEPAGVKFFVDAWNAGTYNINNIAIAILDGAKGDDLATVNAKIAAANIFTANLDQDLERDAYSGDDAAAIARDFINNVDKDDPGTEEEADAAILEIVNAQGGQAPDDGGSVGGGGGGVAPDREATGTIDVNVAVQEGNTVTATLTATDEDIIVSTVYQWQEKVNGQWIDLPNVNGDPQTVKISNDQDVVGDQYRIVVTTTDARGGTTEFVNKYTVQNLNDQPEITITPPAGNVSEGVAQTISTLSFFDEDEDSLQVTLSGSGAAYFDLNRDTGELSFNGKANYEALGPSKELSVVVNVSDGNGGSDSATFNVSVSDVDETITLTRTDPNFDAGNSYANWVVDGHNSSFQTNGVNNIKGGLSDDILDGKGGNDVIDGRDGNDTIVGGTGNDTLTGGEGRDTFVFALLQGVDTITDFSASEDYLDLSSIDISLASGRQGFIFDGTAGPGKVSFSYDNITDTTTVVGKEFNTNSTILEIKLTGDIQLTEANFIL